MLDLVETGGRPADFPVAGLGDGQMLECSGNLDGVDVVEPSCIYNGVNSQRIHELKTVQTAQLQPTVN